MSLTHALPTGNYGVARLIVATSAANGTHTTLASAMAAASAGETIFLRDSVTENVTITPGVNIAAWQGSAGNTPSITGTLTMTGAGISTISGIRLVTNSSFFISVTGSAASQLQVTNCYLDFANNTGIQFTTSSSSASLEFINCRGNIATTGVGIYTHSSAGALSFLYCVINNTGNSTTASSNSAGSVGITGGGVFAPISCSAGTVSLFSTFINTSATNTTGLTTSGTGQGYVYQSAIATGTASAISVGSGTTVNLYNQSVLQSTNANVVTGAGTFQYGEFMTDSSTATNMNVTTQGPLPVIGGGWALIKTLTASASATLDFTTLPVYPVYAFAFNVTIATNAQQLLMRFSNDNGSTFAATGYTAGVNYTSYNSATVTNVNATTSFPITSVASNGTGISGLIYCTPGNANAWGMSSYLSTTSGVQAFATLGGAGNIVPNAFRFLSSSGNITSGTITIYGLKAGN